MSKRLDEATTRELAVRASVCPKTIEKAARGEPVRGLAGHRARAVLAQAGITTFDARGVLRDDDK